MEVVLQRSAVTLDAQLRSELKACADSLLEVLLEVVSSVSASIVLLVVVKGLTVFFPFSGNAASIKAVSRDVVFSPPILLDPGSGSNGPILYSAWSGTVDVSSVIPFSVIMSPNTASWITVSETGIAEVPAPVSAN